MHFSRTSDFAAFFRGQTFIRMAKDSDFPSVTATEVIFHRQLISSEPYERRTIAKIGDEPSGWRVFQKDKSFETKVNNYEMKRTENRWKKTTALKNVGLCFLPNCFLISCCFVLNDEQLQNTVKCAGCERQAINEIIYEFGRFLATPTIKIKYS